jgi:hypothetical protein
LFDWTLYLALRERANETQAARNWTLSVEWTPNERGRKLICKVWMKFIKSAFKTLICIAIVALPICAVQFGWMNRVYIQYLGCLSQEKLIKIAESGDINAEMVLSFRYLLGRGVKKDEVAALEWVRRAATQGEPYSQAILGATYYEGRLLPRDERAAFSWFRKSAEQDNFVGQY